MEKDSLKKKCSLLVIGGSAGSLAIIMEMLPYLKADLGFAIVIVLHRKAAFDTGLSNLFGQKTLLNVKEAEEKEAILPGYIYIAPPDYHLLIEKDHTMSLDYSEKVNFSRPSIDVTLETASEAYRDELVCLLLSGASSDGAAGLAHVKSAGGRALVQNPLNAAVAYMPLQAIENAEVDMIVDNDSIAKVINSL